MRPILRTATLGMLVLTAFLVAPAALVPTAEAKSCPSYGPFLESGEVTVKGYGKLYASGTWTDGCGGNGCDDAVQGSYLYHDVYYYFEVREVRTYSGCAYSCDVQMPGAAEAHRYEDSGRLDFDTNDEAAWFACGDLLTAGFIYHNWHWSQDAVFYVMYSI